VQTERAQLKIRSERLTTCRVAADGSSIGLEFVDRIGATVTVEFPIEQAEAVVMTLPRLLACAVKQRTGNDEARYVFGLDEWSLESARNQGCLIATLKTTDGFEVSFAIPFEACQSLGFSLQQGCNEARVSDDGDEAATVTTAARFN
jgi:hypothetical protein